MGQVRDVLSNRPHPDQMKPITAKRIEVSDAPRTETAQPGHSRDRVRRILFTAETEPAVSLT